MGSRCVVVYIAVCMHTEACTYTRCMSTFGVVSLCVYIVYLYLSSFACVCVCEHVCVCVCVCVCV